MRAATLQRSKRQYRAGPTLFTLSLAIAISGSSGLPWVQDLRSYRGQARQPDSRIRAKLQAFRQRYGINRAEYGQLTR